MVVSKSSQVDHCRHLVHKALGRAVKDMQLHTSTHQEVTQCLKDIRVRGGGGVLYSQLQSEIVRNIGCLRCSFTLPYPTLPSLSSLPSPCLSTPGKSRHCVPDHSSAV